MTLERFEQIGTRNQLALAVRDFKAGDHSFSETAQIRIACFLDQAKILVLASHDDELIRRSCNKILLIDHRGLVKIVAV